jgi:hypothetical protein
VGAEEQQGKSKPTSILSDVLAKAEEKRFTKAVEGVRKGEDAVQITHLSEILVAAYITNGDDKQRGVSIS